MPASHSITASSSSPILSSSAPQTPSPPLKNPEFDPHLPSWRLALLVFSLALGLFLSLLDATIVATALYTIGNDLSSLGNTTWIALAYTLTDMGFATTLAALGDVFGRANVYLGAALVFLVASIGAGCAKSMEGLIAARAVQGLGGSGLYALCFVILADVVPGRLRRWLGALAGSVIAVSGVLGPILGGVITRYTSWRWIFWIK